MSNTSGRPPLHPEVSAFLKRLPEKASDAPTLTSVREDALSTLRRADMHEKNKKRRVHQREKIRIQSRFDELLPSYPNKWSCYEALAIEFGLDVHKIRYRIEGSRGKGTKKRTR